MDPVAADSATPRLVAGVIGIASSVAIGLLGARLFAHAPMWFTLAPLVGLACALSCRRPLDAAIAAAIGVYGGVAASLLGSAPLAPTAQAWAGVVLPGAVIAAVIAAGAAAAISYAPRTSALFAALALGILVGTMWFAQFAIANTPTAGGITPLAAFTGTPPIGPRVSDDALYLLAVHRVASGENYYAVTLDILRKGNESGRGLVDFRSPLAYRLPTLYALYASLAQDGLSFVWAFLVLATAGTLAAYALARRFLVAPVALAGAALVGNYLASHSSWLHLFQTEIWAGTLGLVCVALFVAACAAKRASLALHVAAVVAAVGAAAFRELGLAFLLLGLIATLADTTLRRRRIWALWVAGLVVVALGYAGHAAAVRSAVAHASFSSDLPLFPWFDPTGRGLYAGVFVVAEFLALPMLAAWLLSALGVVGSFVASRERPVRIMLAGAVVGGVVALVFLHPPGGAGGGVVPPYWSGTVFPTLLACVPLAFALAPDVRRASTSALDDASGAAPDQTAPPDDDSVRSDAEIPAA